MQAVAIMGLLLLVVNLTYWLWLLISIHRIPDTIPYSGSGRSKSLIIVAHNDIHNLQKNLDAWRAQDAHNLELILANDGSSDGTEHWLRSLSGINYMNLKKEGPGKKHSLAKAIEASGGDQIILTDSDCRPASTAWIGLMSGWLDNLKVDFFPGYAPLKKTGTWLSRLARFETVVTALQYLSWASRGQPYMGVGRNIIYRKTVLADYLEKSQANIASGDDDLFIQNIADQARCTVNLDPRTFVYSSPPATWSEWLQQKARHTTTSYRYKPFIQAVLAIFALSQILWPLSLGLSATIAFVIILGRYTVLMIAGKKVLDKLDAADLWIYWPLLDICLSIYYLILFPLSLFRNRKKW
ncbi:MAG: glycosyltransferase [Saprospiraceae bacterium]|nr:glycosyltransferase [Saprospiraceae bacterium]